MRTLPASCSVQSAPCAREFFELVKPLIDPCSRCCRKPETAASAKRGTAMSRETLQESLSAVMDNQADELELRRVLAASDDPELRATWSRYQIARAVMHKELLEPRLDIAAAVSAALADDVAPVAQQLQRGPWRTVGRLAVAASVTVAVLAGVGFFNQGRIA